MEPTKGLWSLNILCKLYKLHFLVYLNRVHENIIIIGDPSETSTCFIGDLHAPLETDMPDRRPPCLIADPSETNMPVESNKIFNTYLLKGRYTKYHVKFH